MTTDDRHIDRFKNWRPFGF